jgi:deoxyadenosine/deoxycytidine kinase
MNNEFTRIARQIIKDYPVIKKAMQKLSPANDEKFARLDALMPSFKAYLENPSLLIDIKPQLEDMANIIHSLNRKKTTLEVIAGGLCKNV